MKTEKKVTGLYQPPSKRGKIIWSTIGIVGGAIALATIFARIFH